MAGVSAFAKSLFIKPTILFYSKFSYANINTSILAKTV